MKRLVPALLLSLAAGCSGGNSANVSLPQPVLSPTAAPTGTPKPALATGIATLFIPAASGDARARARRRQWVSPSTMSISISATTPDGYNGYVITAVPANAPNCTAVTGGRTCTLGFDAPPGVDTVQIYAYDATNAYIGNPLATTTVSGVNIAASGNNSLTFTLGGIVGQQPALSPASFNVTQGTPATLTLAIAGFDIDGNPITTYDAPLGITQTDTTGTFTLSAASIADSSVTPSIVVQYDGGSASTTITVATTSTNTANFYGPQQSTITITPAPIP